MAYKPDYTVGSISIEANGTALTGNGTAWQTALFQEGDWFIANGFQNIVQSVNSETSITLAQPWQGGALSNAPYRLRYMSDGSRVSAQARALINLLGGSGNLEGLAALAGVSNRVPYFTSPGTMALAVLTQIGRDIIGANNTAAVWTALGEIANGSLPERLRKGSGTFYDDFNLIPIEGGWYRVNSGATNGPPDITGFAMVLVVPFSESGTANPTGMQLACPPIGASGAQRAPIAYRTMNTATGGWGRWWRLDAPERISNANGTAIQFLDGTMICLNPSTQTAAPDVARGAIFGTTTPTVWTFPVAFVSGAPTVFCQANAAARWGVSSSVTTTKADLAVYSYAQSASGGLVAAMAIGRWF